MSSRFSVRALGPGSVGYIDETMMRALNAIRRRVRATKALLPALTVLCLELSAMEPSTALALANTALGVAASFSAKGDGGLGAMLNAQNQTLRLIVDQLNSVQTQLASITVAVKNIPSQLQEQLALSTFAELTSEIGAVADRYRVLIEASVKDKDLWKNPAVRKEMESILQIVSQRRVRLKQDYRGLSPQAMVAAPVACAVETSLRLRLEFPDSHVRAILNDYLHWVDRFLDPTSQDSLFGQQERLLVDYGDLVSRVTSHRLGGLLGIGPHLTNEVKCVAFKGPDIINFSAVMTIYPFEAEGDCFNARQRMLYITRAGSAAKGGSYYLSGRLIGEPNAALGFSLLRYQQDAPPHLCYMAGTQMLGEAPPDGVLTRWFRVKGYIHEHVLEARSLAQTMEAGEYLSSYRMELNDFQTLLEALNLARARIAAIQSAISTSYSLQREIRIRKSHLP